MKSLIETPPRTLMEVYRGLPEGTLAELIDNVLYMSPAPTFNHQAILRAIFRKLCEEILDTGKGEVIMAPFDVYLDETENAVQPDIIVVLQNNLNILDPKGQIHGVPDILFEILSKSNREHDLVRKRSLYEQFRVKEYWVIDPESKLAIGLSLKGNKYETIAEDVGLIKSSLLQFSFTF